MVITSLSDGIIGDIANLECSQQSKNVRLFFAEFNLVLLGNKS